MIFNNKVIIGRLLKKGKQVFILDDSGNRDSQKEKKI